MCAHLPPPAPAVRCVFLLLWLRVLRLWVLRLRVLRVWVDVCVLILLLLLLLLCSSNSAGRGAGWDARDTPVERARVVAVRVAV